jgi:hypothetical protein
MWGCGFRSSSFTDAGLPANVIDGLNANLDRLEESVAARSGHGQSRSLATLSLDEAERGIRRSVRALDGALRHALAEQPVLFATWQSQKRYPRRPKSGTDTST